MPAQPRFNLPLLRTLRGERSKAPATSWRDEFQISRRQFLGVSAAAGAGVAIPPFLRGEGFSVIRDGASVHVLVRNEQRWTIDATKFGVAAKVGLAKENDRVKITLRNAVFPGTDTCADFEAVLLKADGTWVMGMNMACGMRVQAPLLAWLDSQVDATGEWRVGTLQPCDNFRVIFQKTAQVRFTRDWEFEVASDATAIVHGLEQRLNTNTVRIELNAQGQIAGGPVAPKTLFRLNRGYQSWRVSLGKESAQGWSFEHADYEELFDELQVESVQTDRGAVHSALLLQSEDNSAILRLFTGGGLVSDSGDLFHLRLHNPRLAFGLSDSRTSSALLANLSTEPAWAHGDHASYQFVGTDSAPYLELLDDGKGKPTPQVTPGLCQICFPDDSAAMNLRFGVPRPFRLTWADLISPFQRLGGILHLLPSQHALDIDFDDKSNPDHLLQIDRPRDLLSLRFQFRNMRLITGLNPRIVLRDKKSSGLLSVIFPPQHVAEEAFFHNDDNIGDPNGKIEVKVPVGDVEMRRALSLADDVVLTDTKRVEAKALLDPDNGKKPPNKDSVRPRTLLSGESRIVFRIPNEEAEISFHLDDLLDWGRWEPVVAAVAHTHVDVCDYDKIPNIEQPQDVTAIELPYRVVLSPSELGRWVHSIQPSLQNTNVVELWHTRLAVAAQSVNGQAPAAVADETNTKDRTVRAIWSTDYLAVERSCTPAVLTPISEQDPDGKDFPIHYTYDNDPKTWHDPFRMALDSRDRCEFVHLTSNYRIPKLDNKCVLKPTADQLLSPAPIGVERMMLTSVGGYLRSFGLWEPAKVDQNHQLVVEQWRHIATLGRDQFVRVVYKGYLLPFGHRASLVKVTERKIVVNKDFPKNGYVAILHQRMFIVVQKPIKDFPVLGQPNLGRQLPFRRVEAITLITPDIDLPTIPWPSDLNKTQTQSLFWPAVGGDPFPFHFRFTDVAGNVSEASIPVVFADAEVSQKDGHAQAGLSNYGSLDAIDLYNAGSGGQQDDDSRTTASFSNQKVAFAASNKPGDTQYEATKIAFEVVPPDPKQNVLDLYKHDLPYFYPALPYARVSSTSIKRVTGSSDSTRVVYFQPYVRGGFDPKENRGEVFLQVHDAKQLKLAFGATSSVDKAGGLANPDTAVVGFSRKSGPVGGKTGGAAGNTQARLASAPQPTGSLATYSSGNFNPSEFFGGLTSAKILGAVKLSDIITPLAPGLASNLQKAPQMLEQSLFEIEKIINTVIPVIETLQTTSLVDEDNLKIPNPIAQHLEPQAQRVFALRDAVNAAHSKTQNDSNANADALVLLADTVTEGDLDRQMVGAILDYAAVLESLLSNPTVLAEEALIVFFTNLLNSAIAGAHLDLPNEFATIVTALQTDLTSSLNNGQSSLTKTIATLHSFAEVAADSTVSVIADKVRIARDGLIGEAAAQATLLIDQYAPDLDAVSEVIAAANDIQARLGKFPAKPDLSAIPVLFEQTSGILDDLLQIYQTAGFLGVVASNQMVVDEIKAAETDIAVLWRDIDYLANFATSSKATGAAILALEDACLKLAAKAAPDLAKKVLQNLRALQRGVDAMGSYQPQLAKWKNDPAHVPVEDIRRLTQLLQQLQRQILASLAALQSMVRAKELDAAALAANLAVAVFEKQLTDLAPVLTAADAILGTAAAPQPIETRVLASFAKPDGVGDLLAGPLAGKTAAIQAQLLQIRQNVAGDSGNLGLKLLHYDLSLQVQSSFAAALEWSILDSLPSINATLKTVLDNFKSLNDLANAVTTRVAAVVGAKLCGLRDTWKAFVDSLKPPSSTDSLKNSIYYLFQTSLENISTAFDILCKDVNPPVAAGAAAILSRPSLVLADAQHLFATFKDLFADVRKRIVGLSALSQLLLDQAVAFGKKALAGLVKDFPVPTSVTLSYDWHPDIQPFEPVFLLEDGADFIVTVRASLSLPGGPPPSVDIDATLSKFSINLIGTPSFVIITIDTLKFTSHNGSSPDCRVSIKSVEFGDAMSFVKSLAAALNPSNGPFIELSDGAIKAGFRFAIESLPSAGMTVMGLAIEVAVALPFNGDPLRCEFGISDQQHPFLLSFGIYGGGGFLQLQLGLDGVQLLQGALEFGLVSSISIGPLKGEGFVVAGIYFRIAGSKSRVCGFVHAHGHMDIFGIISLDVDLYVGICYDNGNVSGTATFSVHVSILFFSETFTLQASYSFAGSGGSSASLRQPRRDSPRIENARLSPVAYRVAPYGEPTAPESSEPTAVFISKEDWDAYLDAFELELQGA
jgi:hypothetical protein